MRALLVVLILATLCVAASAQIRPRFASTSPNPVNPSPALVITAPTGLGSIGVSATNQTVSGITTDETSVTSVTYVVTGTTTASGTVSPFTPGANTTFSIGLTLNSGVSTICVTAHDGVNDSPQGCLAFTYSPPDSTAPVVTIRTPTTSTTYPTSTGGNLPVGGDVVEAVGVFGAVQWTNAATSGTGSCTGTTTFSCSVPLQSGQNLITITACDAVPLCGTDSFTVTLTITINIDQTTVPNQTSGVASNPGRQLSATGGTGAKTWTNNGAGTTLNDADGDCANTAISSSGLITWTSSVAAGVCSFTAKVTDSDSPTPNFDTQPLSITFQMAGTEGPYDYYNTISAFPEKQYSSALRLTADVTSLATHSQTSTWTGLWTCNYAGDSYIDKQDACKRTQLATQYSLSGGQAPRMSINKSSGEVLIIYDEFRTPDWRSNSVCGGHLKVSAGDQFAYKTFRFDVLNPSTLNANYPFFQFQVGMLNPGNLPQVGATNCDDWATVSARPLLVEGANVPQIVVGGPPASVSWPCTGQSSMAAGATKLKHSMWVRHFVRVSLSVTESAFSTWNAACTTTIPAGTYNKLSYWTWTEGDVAPKRVFYDAPFPVGSPIAMPLLNYFYFGEDNTSTNQIAAFGAITFTGPDTTNIPLGTLVKLPNNLRYKTLSAGTISGGTLTVQGTSASGGDAGPNSNSTIGTVLTLVTPITGVTAAVSTAFTGGAPLFTDTNITYWRGFTFLHNYSLPSTPENDTTVFKAPVR